MKKKILDMSSADIWDNAASINVKLPGWAEADKYEFCKA